MKEGRGKKAIYFASFPYLPPMPLLLSISSGKLLVNGSLCGSSTQISQDKNSPPIIMEIFCSILTYPITFPSFFLSCLKIVFVAFHILQR
jgi:hypothetical protein